MRLTRAGRGDLNARGSRGFSGGPRLGSPTAELLEVFEPTLCAGQMEKGIEQHAAVAG